MKNDLLFYGVSGCNGNGKGEFSQYNLRNVELTFLSTGFGIGLIKEIY